jgi:hypothetical protein
VEWDFSEMMIVRVADSEARNLGKNVVSRWGRVMDETSRMGLEIPLIRVELTVYHGGRTKMLQN